VVSLSSLPIDPQNTSSTGLYYTYVTGGSFQLASHFESAKYQATQGSDAMYTVGSNLNLAPFLSGLVGYWPLNEGTGTIAYDQSGYGRTMVMATTNTTLPQWITCPSSTTESCVNFDGLTNYGYAPLGIYTAQNKSLSACGTIYASSTANGPIFGIDSVQPPSMGWNMPFLSITTSSAYGWIYSLSQLSQPIGQNAWHMLCITYDPSGGGQTIFYVDSIPSGTTAGQYSPSNGTNYLSTYISGVKPSGVNNFFGGVIKGLRLYNRALSASEIQALYNATK
jgi:hypothetical protein